MKINFNVTGEDRKALVTAISEIVGWAAVYKKAPTFAYVVKNFTIDKFGTVVFDERTEISEARVLLEELARRGFVPEDSALIYGTADDSAASKAIAGDAVTSTDSPCIEVSLDNSNGDSAIGHKNVSNNGTASVLDAGVNDEVGEHATAEFSGSVSGEDNNESDNISGDDFFETIINGAGKSESVPGVQCVSAPNGDYTNAASSVLIENLADDANSRLTVEMPLDGFSKTTLDNLDKLIASKAALIMKAICTDELPVKKTGDTIRFPWFNSGASSEEVRAYTQFITALCDMAKRQKRVTAREKPAESEKFAFRCFLLRLGFIGDEYKEARKVLLANLEGNGSFKNANREEQRDSLPTDISAAPIGLECDAGNTMEERTGEADDANIICKEASYA